MQSSLDSRFPTLAQSVADWIGEEVLSGRWERGRRITEAEVAALLGVSRQPVREALRLLVEQGLIRITPRVGAVVADYDAGVIEQTYHVRAELESWLIRLGIPRATPEELEWVRRKAAELADRRSELADPAPFYEGAWAIRRRIMNWSGNSVGVELAADLRLRLRRLPKVLQRDPDHFDLVRRVLDDLVSAAERGDSDAGAAIVTGYLLGNIDRVQRGLASNALPDGARTV